MMDYDWEILYKAIYKGLCPNCKNDINDMELLIKGICNKCSPIFTEDEKTIYLKLKEIERIGEFAKLLELKYEIESGKVNYQDVLKSLYEEITTLMVTLHKN